jgi:predicted Zn-dependent protease
MRRRVLWVGLLLAASLGGLGFWARRESSPDVVYRKASAAYFAGRYDEAAAGIDRLARLRSPNHFDRLLRGMVAAARNQPDQAIAELAQIGDEDPLAPLARITAGQTEIRRSRTRAAEAAFLAALKLVPSAIQARHELVFIYNIQHRQLEMDAQLTALAATEILGFQYLHHWSKTRNVVWSPKADLPALERFVQADPEDRWSRLALAEGLRRLSRREEAEKVLSYLPDSDPEARAARATLALDQGDVAAAEALVARGEGDCPSLARLRGQLALLHHDAPAAVRAYRTALAADPLDRSTLAGLGTALKMSGDDKSAQPYLEAASRHDALWGLIARGATAEGERDPKLPLQMGVGLAAVGRIMEARAWLRLAIHNDPADTRAQEELFKLEHQNENSPALPLPISARGK